MSDYRLDAILLKAPARSTGCDSLRSSLASLVAVLASSHRVEAGGPFQSRPVAGSVERSRVVVPAER
jgi:hypothetical protein